MAKKVLVYAYLEGNLGDDLMVWILCRRYPHVQFRVLAHESYKTTFRELKNLKVYSFNDRQVVMWNKALNVVKHGKEDFFRRMVRKADAVVHIGGSVYTQHENYQMSFMSDYVLRDTSRRMYVCGANFGPYRDESFYQNYYNLLARYDGVCFRDRYSYGLFEALPNVRYASDVVFNYRPSAHIQKGDEKKQVLISAIQMKNRGGAFAICGYAEDYRNFMAAITEKYIDSGYRVKFVSFCKLQGDPEAAAEIIDCISPEKRTMIEQYVYENNPEEAVSLFDESEIVIGTRFHSIILGWLKDKKVLPVVYDAKTLHTLEDNGCDSYVTLDQLKWADVDRLAGQAQRLPTELREQLLKDSQNQFADLDGFLNEL